MVGFLLLDREEKYIRTLKNVTNAIHTEEINGQDILEISTLDYEGIEKKYRILYKTKYGYWKEFIIQEIEETHDIEGLGKTIFCEFSFYETLGDYIEDKRPQNTTANIALEIALHPTRWEVGRVDNLGIASTSFYNISSKEAVSKILEAWKCEIRTRVEVSGNKITHRYVDLLEKRGVDKKARFTYSKNIESITRTIHRDDVITALYGYGKGEEVGDGYGRRINFADINNGKAYVENNEARLIWGRNNLDGTKNHVFGKVEFDDEEDEETVLQMTTEKLEELSKPLITYQMSGIDLGNVDLGDTCVATDKEFNPELRVQARIVKIERDLLEEDNNKLTVGNFIPNIIDSTLEQEKHINNFRDKQGVWDRSRIIEEDGTINAQFLNNLVDELNTRMNSQGGYVFISDEGDGIITYDKPNPDEATKAIQLLGGSFRIANSKLPNGEWDWRTFGTGDGFLADLITAGVLKGGQVHFDLTNGTFLIGNSIEDYKILFDGSSLKINLSNGKSIEETIEDIELTPGPPGNDGISVTSVDVEFYLSTSATTLTGGSWQSTAPTWIDGRFMWTRTKTTYSSGDPTYTDPINVTGAKGSDGTDGSDGRSVSRLDEQYYLSNSKTSLTGGTWVDTPPTWTNGKYMWTRIKITYANPSGTAYTDHVVDAAWEAIDGIEVGGRNLLRNTGFTDGTSGWSGCTLSEIDGEIVARVAGTMSESSNLLMEPNQYYTTTMEIYPTVDVPIGSTTPLHTYFRSDSANNGGIASRTVVQQGSIAKANEWTRITEVVKTNESVTTYKFHVYYPAYINSTSPAYIRNIKLEKGNKATDWTPAPEDIDAKIDEKADQDKVDEIEESLSDMETVSATREELGELLSALNDYKDALENAEIDLNTAKDEIANLMNRVPGIESNLGEFIQTWQFLDTYVRLGEEGLVIGSEEGSTAIRITDNRIDFLDGTGDPVAYITNQIMRINRGIFVDSAQIGEHKIETIASGHTVFTWMGGV